MERAIQVQLLNFITDNKILSINQSGFRRNHSTETTVVFLVDNILERMDKRQFTGSVFIDLKKAFDVVNHNYLLYKLEHYGVRNDSLDWFRNYLTTRTQTVNFGNVLSTNSNVDYGVPQGSILGPLLFILFINDLPQCLENCSISMYADDTVIYYSAAILKSVQTVVQDDMDKIALWMVDNELLLNESKTKTLLFGTRQKLGEGADFDININGTKLEQVYSFKYLGMTLDYQLNWKEQVESVSMKISNRLKLLSRIRSCLTPAAAKCVYNGLIQPIFYYCDVTWSKVSEGCSHELQRLQNKAARTILQLTRTGDSLNILNWMNLENRRAMHVCILVFKCMNALVPDYLNNYFSQNKNIPNYNTRLKTDLHLPRVKL